MSALSRQISSVNSMCARRGEDRYEFLKTARKNTGQDRRHPGRSEDAAPAFVAR